MIFGSVWSEIGGAFHLTKFCAWANIVITLAPCWPKNSVKSSDNALLYKYGRQRQNSTNSRLGLKRLLDWRSLKYKESLVSSTGISKDSLVLRVKWEPGMSTSKSWVRAQSENGSWWDYHFSSFQYFHARRFLPSFFSWSFSSGRVGQARKISVYNSFSLLTGDVDCRNKMRFKSRVLPRSITVKAWKENTIYFPSL